MIVSFVIGTFSHQTRVSTIQLVPIVKNNGALIIATTSFKSSSEFQLYWSKVIENYFFQSANKLPDNRAQ